MIDKHVFKGDGFLVLPDGTNAHEGQTDPHRRFVSEIDFEKLKNVAMEMHIALGNCAFYPHAIEMWKSTEWIMDL